MSDEAMPTGIGANLNRAPARNGKTSMRLNRFKCVFCALAIWLAGCGSQGPLEGGASGTFIGAGETVTVKYAYAQHGGRFGQKSIRVLVTDKPIPKEAMAEEMEYQTKLSMGELKGLEYSIEEDSFWVQYYPGGLQTGGSKLKEFSIENDIVRVRDEASSILHEPTIAGLEKLRGEYARSVSFEARLAAKNH